jgi:hypothetical protein
MRAVASGVQSGRYEHVAKKHSHAAGPAMVGFSVGYGVSASLTVTSGTSTSYSVTVGDLSAESFPDNQYSYGMFTYVQTVEDQEFEVINFWVE